MMRSAEPSRNYLLKPGYAIYKAPDMSSANIKTLCKPNARSRLRYPENSPHNKRENRNSEPLIRKNSIYLIADISLICEYLSGFNRLYDFIYKLKSRSVCGNDRLFIGKIYIPLSIRSVLRLSNQGYRRFNKRLKTL